MRTSRLAIATLASVTLIVTHASAQSILSLPPDGSNQRSAVVQHIGLAEVRIDYSSPDVDGRTGKIWGELVPFGLTNLGFGSGNPAPWRAGANENTVLTVTHDVSIEGQPLAAGSYGVHMIPGPDEWTIIFSRNHTAWGSFFYDDSEDALRVTVKPREADYREWLTFDFIERRPDRATVALHWEYLQIPFTISVEDPDGLYVDQIARELEGPAAFSWHGYQQAAAFCLSRGIRLDQALIWAEQAVSTPFVGQENFTTLQTKAEALAALGRTDESDATMMQALQHPSAGVFQIHAYGRQLVADGRTEKALEVFRLNASRFPDTWPTDLGLARAYSALGDFKRALRHARLALERAPDALNRENIERGIVSLQEGKDIN